MPQGVSPQDVENFFAIRPSLLAFRLVQNSNLLLLAIGLWEMQKNLLNQYSCLYNLI